MAAENIKEYEGEMRWVIRYVLDNKDLNKLDSEERRLLKECVDAGYIDGIEMIQVASGDVRGQMKCAPALTRAGSEFLSRNELAQESVGQSSSQSIDEGKYKAFKRIMEGIIITVIGGWIIWKLGWG